MIEIRIKPEIEPSKLRRGYKEYYIALRDTLDFITGSKSTAIKWLDKLIKDKVVYLIGPSADDRLRYARLTEIGAWRAFNVIDHGVNFNTLGTVNNPTHVLGKPHTLKSEVATSWSNFDDRYNGDKAFRIKVDMKRALDLPLPNYLND